MHTAVHHFHGDYPFKPSMAYKMRQSHYAI